MKIALMYLGSTVISTVNPDAWAPVANSVLAIVILVLSFKHSKEVKQVKAEVLEAKADVRQVAEIAASAADAAHSTARIAKDVGGALRDARAEAIKVTPTDA